jgi:hypothetical protein
MRIGHVPASKPAAGTVAGRGRPHVPPGCVNWRPWLEDRALRQMQGLPPEAFDMLVRTLARICDDPYDPVFSAPVPPVAGRRVADLGDFGFIEFVADEATKLVRVYHLVWTG